MAPRGYIDGIPINSFDTATARAMAGYLIDKSPRPDPGIPNILIGAGFDRKTAIDAYYFMLAEMRPFFLRSMAEDARSTRFKCILWACVLIYSPGSALYVIGLGPWHARAFLAFGVSLLFPLIPALIALSEHRREKSLRMLLAQVGFR